MHVAPDSLEAEFLADHQIVTRDLRELSAAVERRDRTAAIRLAARLDRSAGPHIEFEELSFYPVLIESLGPRAVGELYREHDCGRRALQLLQCAGDQPLDWEELADLLGTAMEHVLSCGSLTSYLTGMGAERRAALAAAMVESRRRGTPWTRIARGPAATGPAGVG